MCMRWRCRRIRSARGLWLDALEAVTELAAPHVDGDPGVGARTHEAGLAVHAVHRDLVAQDDLSQQPARDVLVAVLADHVLEQRAVARLCGVDRIEDGQLVFGLRAGGARLVAGDAPPLRKLTGPLMGMMVLPYLGPAAAQKENAAPIPPRQPRERAASKDPLRDLQMRLTYRTVRVLLAIAESSGSSNREVGAAAGIDDQGQISKLLSRLERLGLIENAGAGQVRGAPNAWTLTERGVEVERLVAGQSSVGAVS